MGRAQARSAGAKPIAASSVYGVMGFASLYPSYGSCENGRAKHGHSHSSILLRPYLIGATTLGFFQAETSTFFGSIPVST
jgi:hypothetical protein